MASSTGSLTQFLPAAFGCLAAPAESSHRLGCCIDAWCFTPNEVREALTGDRLLNPSLDLGTACDLDCCYCFSRTATPTRQHSPPPHLSLHDRLAVLRDFARAGARTVNLVGAGEPTLDTFLLRIVDFIHQHGMRTLLFTNGIRLQRRPRLLEPLFSMRCSIVLKFNSLRRHVQDAVVRRPDYSKLRDRALRLLLDHGFSSTQPTRLGIDTLAFRGNLREIPRLHRWCRLHNIHPMSTDYIPAGRARSGSPTSLTGAHHQSGCARSLSRPLVSAPSPDDRQLLARAVSDIDTLLRLPHITPGAYYGGTKCLQLLGVYVDVTGAIWPCVAKGQMLDSRRVDEPLGNARSGLRPSTAWRSSQYLADLRARFDGTCPYKDRMPTLP